MCFYASYRCPVSADFYGINPCFVQEYPNFKCILFFVAAKGEVTAIELYRYMERRSSIIYTIQNFKQYTTPVFNIASIRVSSVINGRRDEAAQKEKVGCMDLYPVKAGFFGSYSGIDKLLLYKGN